MWRLALLPIDAAKTSLQVNGENGIKLLQERVSKEGITALFSGGVASSLATLVGHYPWFLTYNYLSDNLMTSQQFIDYIHLFTSSLALHTASSLQLTGTDIDLDLLTFTPIFAHFPLDFSYSTSVLSHLLTVSTTHVLLCCSCCKYYTCCIVYVL